MKNPAPYIREELVSLLDGAITYDGVVVPCYAGQGEDVRYQIYIGETTGTDISTRDSFNGRWEQVVEVISKDHTSRNEHIDIIGGQVMNILRPTPRTSGIGSNADFIMEVSKLNPPRYMNEQSGEGTWFNRLILRIELLTTQI